MILSEIQRVIVYKSQQEAAMDQFISDNPVPILIFLGVIGILLIGSFIQNLR